MTVVIVGAGAVSPLGLGWRGLSESGQPGRTTLLDASHPGIAGFEVPALPEALDAGDAKNRRLMSRSARSIADANPSTTSALSALTGGLSI